MLAATALCLAVLTQPGWPEFFRGVVVERGTGRPVPGASIRFGDEADAPTATTDDQGQFDHVPVGRSRPFAQVGQPGPVARVRPVDDGAWPWDLVLDLGMQHQPDLARKLAADSLAERAETRWAQARPSASLVVECPPLATIEVVVRDPAGAPLADRPVVVIPRSGSSSGGQVLLNGRTDATGAFRLRVFAGGHRFGIEAPGVGFGATGHIQVAEGLVARLEPPPLARFARVEGQLAPGLAQPGLDVTLAAQPYDRPGDPVAPGDDQGRFRFIDIIPGMYEVKLRAGGQPVATVPLIVRPEPGAVAAALVEPAASRTPAEAESTTRALRQANADRNEVIPYVAGTVRDDRGRPLPAATVYLHSRYHGLQILEEVQEATTDAQGQFRFEGPSRSFLGPLTLIVAAEGRPPAIAYAPGPDAELAKADPKPARLDIAVAAPGSGAAASVTIVRDGRPLPGVAVRLELSGVAGLSRPGYRGDAGRKERQKLRALFVRTAATGPAGVARFANLIPGVHDATATDSPDPAQLDRRGGGEPNLAFGSAAGIAAPPGAEVEATIAVAPRKPEVVRCRILRPDGTPVVGQDVSLSFGPAYASTALQVDGAGIGRFESGVGLRAVAVRFRDPGLKSYPIREEPFYLAEALIPVSPGLPMADPVTLRGVRRDLGSIRARLLDADGRPAPGTILLVEPSRDAVGPAGTVDAAGSIRFADLPSGQYRLRGFVAGQPPAPQPRLGATHLDDAALAGQATVLDREVDLAAGAEASVDLRLEPVGYVRATLHAPAGRRPADYDASFSFDGPSQNYLDHEVDRDGSSHLFGPAPAGRGKIALWERGEMSNTPRGDRPVDVTAGQVVRVEVKVEPDAGPGRPHGPGSRRQAAGRIGGIGQLAPGPEGSTATVYLADGATPAFAARALFFPAEASEPTAEGIADASGRLTWAGRWRNQPDAAEARPGPVREPTIAAWLPGWAGRRAGRSGQAPPPGPPGAERRLRPGDDRRARG